MAPPRPPLPPSAAGLNPPRLPPPLLLALLLISALVATISPTPAHAHKDSGSALAKRTAAFGADVVVVECILAADSSVLGWRTLNVQGTVVGQCEGAEEDQTSTHQQLVFDSPVKRVDVAWLSYPGKHGGSSSSSSGKGAIITELAFTTQSGRRQACGSSSSSFSRRRSGAILRRSSALASKGRALSGLHVDQCFGSSGPSRAKPQSVVSYWSPVSDGWWPEDGGQGCGGGGSRGVGCDGGGGGGSGTTFPHDATGAGARLAALLPKEQYVAMFPMLTDWRCTGNRNVPSGDAWPYRVCTTRFCPENTRYIDWEFNGGKELPYTGKTVPAYARGMYDWEALVEAAESFPGFLRSADAATNKRELAAFLAQISHETTSGEPGTGGLCYREEGPGGDCSVEGVCATWPPVDLVAGCCRPNNDGERTPMPLYCQDAAVCAPGKKYYGRGPKQLSYEYNYKAFGEAVGVPELLQDPDLLLRDRLLPFKSALWFWVTPQGYKPSCSDVMSGRWVPTPRDVAANRKPGFGTVTNIINGGVECPPKVTYITEQQASRIAYYKHYCNILGVEPGDNLSCDKSQNFNY